MAILQEHAKVIYGGPDGELKAQDGVDLSDGAFVCPTLLQTDGPCDSDSPIHNLEVFGPVSTIIPFDGSAAEAVAQVRHGQGCLVSSIYADNAKFLQESILGLAAWHGRLVVVDEQVAEKALAPKLGHSSITPWWSWSCGRRRRTRWFKRHEALSTTLSIQGNGPKLSRLIKS